MIEAHQNAASITHGASHWTTNETREVSKTKIWYGVYFPWWYLMRWSMTHPLLVYFCATIAHLLFSTYNVSNVCGTLPQTAVLWISHTEIDLVTWLQRPVSVQSLLVSLKAVCLDSFVLHLYKKINTYINKINKCKCKN